MAIAEQEALVMTLARIVAKRRSSLDGALEGPNADVMTYVSEHGAQIALEVQRWYDCWRVGWLECWRVRWVARDAHGYWHMDRGEQVTCRDLDGVKAYIAQRFPGVLETGLWEPVLWMA